jgi:hypothetical protein
MAEWERSIPQWLQDARLPGVSILRLSTTTADYGRFLLEILDPKPADAFRLSERGLREYLRPQMKRDEIKSGSLGWVVARVSGLTILSHAGSAPGWNCDVKASAGRKSAIVIMTNGDSFQPFYEKLKQDLEFFTQLAA